MKCERATMIWVTTLGAALGGLSAGCEHTVTSDRAPVGTAGEVLLTPDQVRGSKIAIEVAQERKVAGAVTTTGRVCFHDLHVSHVFSPVTGRILRIDAQPGQQVKVGDPLAVIESPDMGSAFSDLSKAQADAVAAEREWHRQKELFEAHAASERDYDAAQNNMDRATAELERARRKARLLKGGDRKDGDSQTYTLRAAIGGEIVARNVNPGAEVQGQYSGGTAIELFTIGDLDPVWVMADLYEVDLARVKRGAEVSVSVIAYPGKVFSGRVDWISDILDPANHTAKMRCSIANPSRELKPEMGATVTVHVDGRQALAIPRNAVLKLGDQDVVFVQLSDTSHGLGTRFVRRPVGVADDEGGEFLPVTRGIVSGDRIVTSGAALLAGMI